MMRISQRRTYHTNELPGWISLFPLLFVGVGLILLAVGGYQMYRGRQSTQWPTVTGVITVSELGKHVDRDTDTGSSSTTYSADISYDYVVDDVAYVNGNVYFGSMQSSDPSTARMVLNRYPVEKRVTVYYNPARPQQAVLEPGIALVAWILPALGLIFATVGGGFTWVVLRMLKNPDSRFSATPSAKVTATSTATSAS